MELFEGNFSNGIIADNNHGNNPLGTGFRNRFTATDDVGNRTVFRLPVNLHVSFRQACVTSSQVSWLAKRA